VRANLNDRVVVDEVPIGGRVRPSIGSIIAGSLTSAQNMIAEFLRLWGNSKPIIVMRHAYCSWARCSRSSSCTTLLIVEPGVQDHRRRVPLWMMTFWTGTACPSRTSHHRSTMPWVHKNESQRFPPSWRASVGVWLSDIWSRIGGNASRRDQSHVNTRHEIFRLVQALAWSNSPTSSIDVLYCWDWLSSLSFGIFQGCPLGFLGSPRCGSVLSIYSQRTAS
jgi:hypothetical protein